MTITPWPHQQSGLDHFWAAVAAGKKRICLTSPTGGGKSLLSSMIIKEGMERGWKSVFHVNRKSLAEQTRKVFEEYDLPIGMRASGYKHDFSQPAQISMTPTETNRSLGKNPSWSLHDASLVIFDEAHSEKSVRAKELIKRYEARRPDTVFCGLTATPLDVWGIYDTLVVAGVNSELRACGAHLFCKEYCPTMPDMLNVQRNSDGEYSEKAVEKHMQPAVVFGHIVKHHRRLNPLLKPAILFAPSVKASITITDMYLAEGIRAAHIDGKSIYYGEKDSEGNPIMEDSSSIIKREELFDRLKNGDIQVLSNRFVLVAGLDFPQVYQIIFATAFGSLTQFLQAGGRVLRNHCTIDHVLSSDHGGNYWRHGSLNDDRIWEIGNSSKKLLDKVIKDRQNGEDREPIVCPKCGAMRLSGGECWDCGHKHTQSGMKVLQTDGTLRQLRGPYIKTRKATNSTGAVKAWNGLYFPVSMSKSNRSMTWKQMLSTYRIKNPDILVFETTDTRGRKRIAAAEKNGEISMLPNHPPVGDIFLWSQKVKDVPRADLIR